MVLPQSRLPRRLPGFGPPAPLTRAGDRRDSPRRRTTTATALAVHCFPDSLAFGRDLARQLGAPFGVISVHRFPDGESLVRVPTPAAARVVVVRSLRDPNVRLVECLLAADALRRGGARHLTLAAPYLPYMRQDTAFEAGQPVSQRVVAAMLRQGFDRVLTIEAHLHRIRVLAEIMPGLSISAAPALAAWIEQHAAEGFLVGPDEESAPWIRAIARRARVPWVVGSKQRHSDRRVRVVLPPLPPDRPAILIDDIASSGATLASAARALRRGGVRQIDALIVHAIFAPGALERIHAAGIRRVVSCDTVPHPTNGIGCAALVASELAGAVGGPGSARRDRRR